MLDLDAIEARARLVLNTYEQRGGLIAYEVVMQDVLLVSTELRFARKQIEADAEVIEAAKEWKTARGYARSSDDHSWWRFTDSVAALDAALAERGE